MQGTKYYAILDHDNDYELKNPGETVWITVGGFTMRVRHTADGGLDARAWARGRELGPALGAFFLQVSNKDQ